MSDEMDLELLYDFKSANENVIYNVSEKFMFEYAEKAFDEQTQFEVRIRVTGGKSYSEFLELFDKNKR